MKNPDEALTAYYKSNGPSMPVDNMLAEILKQKARRGRKLIGGASGFLCGTLLAGLVLAYAMRPVPNQPNDNSAFIARMQMIHSGLASRSNEAHGEATR